MRCIFYDCKSLRELKLTINKATDTYCMFERCPYELKNRMKEQNKGISIN